MRTSDSATSRASDLDRRLLTALRRCGDGPPVARAARALSWSGEHAALWLAAGLAGASLDRPRRRAWLRATVLVGAAHVASMGVKRVVRRPRPQLPGARPLVGTTGRHSFPSSHAASSAAAAVAFGALLPGPLSLFGPFPLAIGVCASRLVAGVHYPSDVAAGAALGAATARLGQAWSLRGGGLHG
ncbi:phosphatase PAP2 family protein [Streptomyces sp. H39-S7]|uniref:phosphatase PAP2 family protein n=1 Tax=Streptomyces sp. H39-S7 TaxID=3004357 RepID=UPI0022B0386C|nr:phosphatase PAP2 family protein [Streptomyces sp. H39-S7]MCZ4120688.1 phosphatase PAP2 family protein [Streptomyces sp. H39-S7]